MGHGHTTGERAQGLSNFHDDFCEPALAHCMARKKEEGEDLPLFMLGHSMGGLVCVMAAYLCPPGIKKICSFSFIISNLLRAF